MAVGMNITWKKGMGNKYHNPYNIEAVGKKWGTGGGDGSFGE